MRLDRVKVIMLMAQKELSANEMTERSGLSRGTVTAVRSGKSCSATTAGKIAKALGVDVTEILAKEKE